MRCHSRTVRVATISGQAMLNRRLTVPSQVREMVAGSLTMKASRATPPMLMARPARMVRAIQRLKKRSGLAAAPMAWSTDEGTVLEKFFRTPGTTQAQRQPGGGGHPDLANGAFPSSGAISRSISAMARAISAAPRHSTVRYEAWQTLTIYWTDLGLPHRPSWQRTGGYRAGSHFELSCRHDDLDGNHQLECIDVGDADAVERYRLAIISSGNS